MNAEQLNAIKERVARATPAPWRHAGLYSVYTNEDISIPVRPSDAEFIAKSREDVPALVAEVERLRKEIAFIAHVDKEKGAYDLQHLATSIECWALNVLDGINHDNTTAEWYKRDSI